MVLRAKKPKEIPKRFKVFMYGPAGVGKTTAAIQLPKPYVIDTERGTDHYAEVIEKSGGVVFQTTLMDELIEEVRSLISEKHDYLTLVIDPITTVYQDLLDHAEKQVGAQFGRHYGEANKQMKRLANLLMTLDMNVVVTAHAKPVYGDNMRVLGNTFDGWKRLDYLFDLVLELDRRGKKRVAQIIKTRIAAFPDGDTFEWSYDTVADRYGRDVLERHAAHDQLVTNDHLREFDRLISQLSDADRKRLGIDCALAGIDDLRDLSDERCVKGIEIITNHLNQSTS